MDHRDSGESRDQAISKVSYTHDAMIDMIIQNPQISQSELAVMFGYTAPWISRIMASDAFQERLAQRRHEMVDPGIAQTLDEGFREVAQKSLQVLKTHLENPIHPDSTVKIAALAAKALNFGGFALGKEAPTPPPPDRLEKLAERLEAFIPRPLPISEAVIVSETPAA